MSHHTVDTRTAHERLCSRLQRAIGNGLDLTEEELGYLADLLRDEDSQIGRIVRFKILDYRDELAGQKLFSETLVRTPQQTLRCPHAKHSRSPIRRPCFRR